MWIKSIFEMVLLASIKNKDFIMALESTILNNMHFDYLQDIFMFVEMARNPDYFSRRFNEGLFNKCLELID